MKNILKIALPIIAALAVVSCSCKDDAPVEKSIYDRLSGIWNTNRAGSPTLYIIPTDDYCIYYYTYPYPIDPKDEEAGQISVSQNVITFINLSDNTSAEYAYTLSDNDTTLTLAAANGTTLVYTRQR